MTPRAVVVAHRAAMIAEGIAAALARYPEIVPIGVATTALEGLRHGERADAVALDQYLEGAGATATRLRRKGVRVVLIGEGTEDDEGVWVSTRAPVSALAAALVPGLREDRPAVGDLSPREREVLALVSRGLPAKLVARRLGISPKTVEQHKTRIFAKLGVTNQAAAVRAVMDRAAEEGALWSRSSI